MDILLPETLKLLTRLETFSLSFNSDLTALHLCSAVAGISAGYVHSICPAWKSTRAPQHQWTRSIFLSGICALDNLFLRGTSPATVKVLTTALAVATDPPLRQLALTPRSKTASQRPPVISSRQTLCALSIQTFAINSFLSSMLFTFMSSRILFYLPRPLHKCQLVLPAASSRTIDLRVALLPQLRSHTVATVYRMTRSGERLQCSRMTRAWRTHSFTEVPDQI